jgi:hypothetical protein
MTQLGQDRRGSNYFGQGRKLVGALSSKDPSPHGLLQWAGWNVTRWHTSPTGCFAQDTEYINPR